MKKFRLPPISGADSMDQHSRILIVDDDPMAIQILYKALEGQGEIRFASGGFEALALLAESPVDLVLLDLMMPVMDGYSTCTAIKREYPNVPVIFVTAASDFDSEIRALQAGAVDFISKPINPPVVRARVGAQVAIKQARDLLAHEVEERKKTEKALRESDERFRAYMDNSPAIAWMKNETGQYVYLSRTYRMRFGVRLEDWLGKTDFELWPQEIAKEFSKNDQAVLTSGQVLEVIEETPDPDGGHCHWWNFRFLFTDACGKRYVGGIGLDITERKQAEEERERLIQQLQDSVAQIKTLRGLLPICASCKKIRNDKGYWESIEVYISEHSEARFSHGICLECARKIYPEFFQKE
jgi:PAS domain S-box-containing protein